ncbi:MAG: LamG-like jellyroll fold domain-containing protein [Bacteroidia bacterium]
MKRKLLTVSLLLALASCTLGQTLNDSLKAHFRFSGNANDISGNGNHATVLGAVPAKGLLGSDSTAYEFDDLGDQIQFPADDMQGIEYTYSLWINPKKALTGGNSEGLIKISGSSCHQAIFRVNDFNSYTGLIAEGHGTNFSYFYANAPQMPEANTWTHVVAVKTRDSIKVFVNGQVGGSIETPSQDPCYGGTVISGKLGQTGVGSTFIGSVDEVRIYTRPLSDTEVAGLYNMELTSFGSEKVQLKCRIYPNPSENQEVYLDVEAEIQDVLVFDLQGKLMKTDFISGEKKIKLTELVAGTYILQAHTNEGVIRERIILQ